MSGEKISVDSDKVTINDYEITDEDVVKYFEALAQDGTNLQEGLDKLLKLGALATKATTAGLTTEYIDKEMSKLQDQLSKEIEQNFGENGTIPQFLAENLGVDGKIAKEVLNPSVSGSPINILGVRLLEEIEKIKTKLNIQETEQRGTQKGFVFEDYCFERLSKLAKVFGDIIEPTGEVTGLIDKKGDYVWTVSASGLKIVFEMKDMKSITLPYIKEQLDGGMKNRAAQYGVFISRKTEALPKMVGLFNEYDNNKLVIALGSELEDETIHDDLIRVAVGWALTKLKLDSGQSSGIKPGEIRVKIQSVEEKLNSFTQIKSKCTSISKDTEKIEELADEIKQDIADSLKEVVTLINENSDEESTEEKSKDVLDL